VPARPDKEPRKREKASGFCEFSYCTSKFGVVSNGAGQTASLPDQISGVIITFITTTAKFFTTRTSRLIAALPQKSEIAVG
jgi:hypothetical protein